MSSTSRWAWLLYFAFFATIVLGEAYSILSPRTPQHLYFTILRAFDPIFNIPYGMTLARTVLNLIHCLPLALYIDGRRWGPPRFWQVLLVLRLIFDMMGHPYECKALISLYYADPRWCILSFVIVLIPILPSYWACGRYAFGRKST